MYACRFHNQHVGIKMKCAYCCNALTVAGTRMEFDYFMHWVTNLPEYPVSINDPIVKSKAQSSVGKFRKTSSLTEKECAVATAADDVGEAVRPPRTLYESEDTPTPVTGGWVRDAGAGAAADAHCVVTGERRGGESPSSKPERGSTL